MKKLFKPILLAAAVLFAMASAEKVYGQDAKQDSTTSKNIVCYEVFGMDCPGCQSSLEKQIKKIEGVADASASWEKKEVVITLEEGAVIEEKEIIRRIKKANFTPGKKIEPAKGEKNDQ